MVVYQPINLRHYPRPFVYTFIETHLISTKSISEYNFLVFGSIYPTLSTQKNIFSTLNQLIFT
ncbi:MAG: hypothetical protein A3H98_03700 [Bacteroidetes bacterium RIFCSPLOWO2_02_FULL_36_8]|nr:MAG: hypothetical protein A3H98_03700 [Bacteroidetes bacterium RIFCSPLOWO2_02_FULL_36_8]OFY69546.1 MAG: hypothetical protein A3G23_10945 [Bacteroidetes bacterium RIFCSPLOWO2_12_FULL_37_12]